MDQFEEMTEKEKKEKAAIEEFGKFCSKLKDKYVRNNSNLDFYYSNIHKSFWCDMIHMLYLKVYLCQYIFCEHYL